MKILNLNIFQIIFTIDLIVIGIIRIYFGKHRLKTQYKISINPIIERINSYLVSFGMIYFPLMNILFGYFGKFYIEIPNIFKIISSLIMTIDIIIFYLSHKDLADSWSPFLEIKDKQKLVKSGIYKYIRHPMYLSMWIFAIFEGFVLSNYFIGIFGVLTWANLYFVRVSNEEKMMLDTFGEEYEKYIENTGRLLPKIKKSKKL